MSYQPSADSFGIRLLGVKCSWWHPRQANDAVASERSIFSTKKHGYKSFVCIAVNPLVPIFWDLHAYCGRKLRTGTHTHKAKAKKSKVFHCHLAVTQSGITGVPVH